MHDASTQRARQPVGLRERRQSKGLNQTELADAAGCRQSTISQIETGKRRGSLDLLAAVARALGCTVDDLLPVPET